MEYDILLNSESILLKRSKCSIHSILSFQFTYICDVSKSLMDNQSLSSKHNDWECGSMSKGGGLLAEQALV